MALPSDEELNRVVEEDKKRRGEAIINLLSDPEVYEHRLRERGYREYTFYGKGRYKGKRLTNITPRQTASAAVNQGSIKALTTTAIPKNPSIAWLRAIDKNTGIDQGRQDTALEKKHSLLAEQTEIEDQGRLPAKGVGRPLPQKDDGPDEQ